MNSLKKIENSLVNILDDMSKEGFQLSYALVKTFYNVETDVLHHFKKNYINTRFKYFLDECFYKEEKCISKKELKKFYSNIDASKINILFTLLDKARKSTFDIHARILAKLYGSYYRFGSLNYFESSLLANIDTLNDVDFEIFYKYFNSNKVTKNDKELCTIEIQSSEVVIAFEKFLYIGVLNRKEEGMSFGNGKFKSHINFFENEYTQTFYNILKEIYNKTK